MGFTREELDAMRAADAEIEESFVMTQEEREEARVRDRDSAAQMKTPQELKRLQYHRDYYRKNRERVREQQKAYNLAHKEEIREQKARYYEKNKEAIRAEIRDRHRADPEKRRARDRAYYQKNREAVLAKNRESYYRADPEKRRARDRAYYQANREKILARNKRYRDRAKERRGVSEAERDPKGQR